MSGADSREPAEVACEHLQRVAESEENAATQYIQKAQWMLSVVLVLFGAISFGLTKTAWMAKSNCRPFAAVTFALLVLAGISLCVAFWFGINCLAIRSYSTVGIKRLHEKLKSGDVANSSSRDMQKGFAQNLSATILKNRDVDRARHKDAIRLQRFLRVGFLLTAGFLILAISGDTFFSNQEDAMDPRDQDSSTQNQQSQSDSSLSQDASNDYVEQSDVMQKSGSSNAETR